MIDTVDDLRPRRYQDEIAGYAQSSNVIAALDTGSGKTYISTLLIKWMCAQNSSKRVVFLVPKVALALQQAEYLEKHTTLDVLKLHGSLETDLSNRSYWEKKLSQHEILVMTAQTFVNFITHSVWSIAKTSLLVFDECHHCRKNHPYNVIMREYFQVSPTDRPKVFGMTASPIWNPNDAEASLAELETNMDSKTISVKENIEELLRSVPKPAEIIHEYPPAPSIYPEYPSDLLRALKTFSGLYSALDIPWHSIETRYNATFHNLGPYCAELYLYDEMKARLDLAVDISTLSGRSLDPDVIQIQYILDDFSAFFVVTQATGFPSVCLPVPVPLDYCTPKVDALVSILLSSSEPLSASTLEGESSLLSKFQAIIFVEQRHIAVCLARVLPCIPELKGRFKCAALLGQGTGLDGGPKGLSSAAGGRDYSKKDVAKMFRDGKLDILIATSVAEEGLDFPDCSLIVRFDPLQHMVGYVQSRGRARSKVDPKFVVMVPQNDEMQIARYRLLAESEPQVRRIWADRGRESLPTPGINDAGDVDLGDGDDDGDNEFDMARRQRFVVPETGAILTYDNAVDLLNQLCALIPCDQYTPTHLPKYLISIAPPTSIDSSFEPQSAAAVDSTPSIQFICSIRLPSPLPVPAHSLIHVGHPKLSKREAKRAAAFRAVKALRELNVYDEFLLPATHGKASGYKGRISGGVDVDERAYVDIRDVQAMMDVKVRDPWGTSFERASIRRRDLSDKQRRWIHVVSIYGRRSAGFIGDSWFPSCTLGGVGGPEVTVGEGISIRISGAQINLLEEYTMIGLKYCVTGRPLATPLPFFLAPLFGGENIQVDWEAVNRLVANPIGNHDWSDIKAADCGHLLVENSNQHGTSLLLQSIRHDLNPLSTPPTTSREASFETYYDYWIKRWSRKNWEARVPIDGPLLEVSRIVKRDSALYDIYENETKKVIAPREPETYLVAQGSCRWVDIPEQMRSAFMVLPQIARRITDINRVHRARLDFGLPEIEPDLLVEALTIPSAAMPFNNQRLETLGDSVLKLCVSVHAFQRYPHRHEGQLTSLRQATVSNWCLLARAKELALERYVISERPESRSWEYANANQGKDNSADDRNEDSGFDGRRKVLEPDDGLANSSRRTARREVSRNYPRRSLQDCMEAILGAAFVSGGLPMALRAGQSLGLSFGGIQPWPRRYADCSQQDVAHGAAALFHGLEAGMGYTFHRNDLLLESVTHPSFSSETGGSSYQRLEFLGDAVIDLVVMKYLYSKFPDATSDQLSWPRTRAVCSTALAWVSVTRLEVHKVILANNVELSMAVEQAVPALQACCAADIVTSGWRHDPPKVLSDVLESLMGAVLVDSGWNFDRAEAVVENLMADILSELSPSLRRDPVSEMVLWMARKGCRNIKWIKLEPDPLMCRAGGVVVSVHGMEIAGPMLSASMNTAKFAAAEKALEILQDRASENCLANICDCAKQKALDLAGIEHKLPCLSDEDEGDAADADEAFPALKN